MATTESVEIEAKPFWLSKVFWLNALALLAVIADWLIERNLFFVEQEWFVTVVAAINMLLRFTTSRPIRGSHKWMLVKKRA